MRARSIRRGVVRSTTHLRCNDRSGEPGRIFLEADVKQRPNVVAVGEKLVSLIHAE
jgi:hypothetical protein